MTEDHELQPRSLALLIVSAIPALFALYAALQTGDLMAAHRQMLESFGAPISPLTEFVLNAPNLWWVIALPAVAVFLWVALKPRVTRTQKVRMRLAVIAVFVFGVAVYGLAFYALRMPIIEMGGAI